MKIKHLLGAASVLAAFASTQTFAAPVNGNGQASPDYFNGSGMTNEDFTGVSQNGVELALRGKLRYDLNGQPQNVYNYDGIDTYTFDPADSNAPADRSIFNFEFSINSDTLGAGRALNALTYALTIDSDPSAAVSGATFDVINGGPFDHALGFGTTTDGSDEVVDLINYNSLIGVRTVAQNSWNLGFGTPWSATPQAPGIYTFTLSAFLDNDELASTSINVVVGSAAAVPLPATLPLLLSGLALLGFQRRRQA